MTTDEIILLLNASQPKPLTPLQELVLRSAWEGKTYAAMTAEAHYGAQRIREVAAHLWRSLSDYWGEPITKANFRDILERHPLTKAQQQLIERYRHPLAPTSLEFPSGPVSLDSKFYIPRPPIEELAYSEITEPGCVIRIKAPRQMGKSSLMLRILDRATTFGYRTVSLDFQQGDAAIFTNLDKFLRWFCAYVTRQLNLESKLNSYWDEEIGSKVSCTTYFQTHLLAAIESPLVLALNEANRICEHPEIAREFFSLLRFWHEQAKQVKIWQKFRLIVTYSTDFDILLNLNQSPLNVGLPLNLPRFNCQQVQELARRYGLDWTDGKEAKRLIEIVGGHPYLVRLALYHLMNTSESSVDRLGKCGGWNQFLQEAASPQGIYHEHLQQLLTTLQADPQLVTAYQQVISTSNSVRLEPCLAYKLYNMGLVNLVGGCCSPTCELYRLYFAPKLLSETPASSPTCLNQSQQTQQDLPELIHRDELTQIANRRYFELYLEKAWAMLAQERKPLSLILADIDHFQIYNTTHSREAGDACLQQIATVINKVVEFPVDLVARYRDDEFVLILSATSADIAFQVAEIIRKEVKNLAIAHDIYKFGGLPAPFVTLSLGIASIIPDREEPPLLLVQEAESALIQSKRNGRNRATISSGLEWL